MQTSRRKRLLVPAVIAVVLAAVLIGIYFAGVSGGKSNSSLPSGCTKPAGGFLIIASNQGYNDSIGHGAPNKNWPIITVHKGQTVSITVCNTDTQAHGFQITYYYDSFIQSIAPNTVLHVPPFVANETGSFRIYCDIFCTIHIFMQSGELIVTQ